MYKVILFICLCLRPFISLSQLFSNSGFEQIAMDGFAKYWDDYPASGACSITSDSLMVYSGKYSIKIDHYKHDKQNSSSYIVNAINTSTIPAVNKIVVTAWVRSDVLQDSSVCILMNDESKKLFTECFFKRQQRRNNCRWQKLIITKEFSEPQKFWQILLVACVKANGSAWFDNFSVSIDGRDIGESPVVNFTNNDRNWLNENVIKDNGATMESFFKKIGMLAGNKYLLGAGEPTHGTREAYLFKINLFKYLVQHNQFRIVALENGMAESYVIDKYINGQYLQGSSMSKLEYRKYLNDFIYTEEMIDFIEWMRTFNQSHSDKINCVGMDVQTHEQCIRNIKEILSDLGISNLSAQADSIASAILKLRSQNIDDVCMRKYILKQLDSLAYSCKICLQHSVCEGNLISWLYQHIELIRDFLMEDEARWNNYSKRSKFMINNLLWFFNTQHIDKAMIWAHNGHINKIKGPQNIFQREGSLGNFLKSSFGNDYHCIGILTADGTYSALISEVDERRQTFPLDKPSKNTIEHYLSMTNSPAYYLDLSKTDNKGFPTFLNRNIHQRSSGMIYDRNQFYSLGTIVELYDAIYFVQKSMSTQNVSQ